MVGLSQARRAAERARAYHPDKRRAPQETRVPLEIGLGFWRRIEREQVGIGPQLGIGRMGRAAGIDVEDLAAEGDRQRINAGRWGGGGGCAFLLARVTLRP